MAATAYATPATAPQMNFLRSLTTDRDATALDRNDLATLDYLARFVNGEPLAKDEASILIGALKRCPWRPRTPKTTTTAPVAAAPRERVEDGMYRTPDGTIYKVQFAVHGSGRRYAKRLVVDQAWERAADGAVIREGRSHFDYEAGAIDRLTSAMRMTLDEAKAFGALYGTCCQCGRTLTDEKSIAAGIGPVCAGKW